MSCEEQILELMKRIEVLEKAESKRILKHKREITFKIIKVTLILVIIVVIISFIYINYINPYKKKIDDFEQKINTVEDFVTDNLDIFKNWNPFS